MWLLSDSRIVAKTEQGSRHLPVSQRQVSDKHLDYYLDEFTFRFNRRHSRARGLLFYRLLQQAVQLGPRPYHLLISERPTPPDPRSDS